MTQDRIEQLASTPAVLAHLVVEASGDMLDRAPAPGEWPPRLVLAHLRDIEYLSWRPGLERALGEDRPELALFDTERWVAGRSRARDRKEHLLADFALQRQASLGILRALEASSWRRTLRAPRLGEFDVSALVDAWATHDAEHVAQLERALGETLAEAQARRTAWAASYPRPGGATG